MTKIAEKLQTGKTAFHLARNPFLPVNLIAEIVQVIRKGIYYGKPNYAGLRDQLILDIQSDGLVITGKYGSFAEQCCGKWTIGIQSLTIEEETVKAYIQGTGDLLYRETPESEREYEEFEKEIEYTFEDLEIGEEFHALGLQDQIAEVVDQVVNAIQQQY